MPLQPELERLLSEYGRETVESALRDRSLPATMDGALASLPPEGAGASPSDREGRAPDGSSNPSRLPERYVDLGVIGVGGMGLVHRVRDRVLGRVCALKVLRPDRSQPALRARFIDEAQISAQLQHPNIPPIYDAGTLADGRFWFTMKEVRGRTLADVIAEFTSARAATGEFHTPDEDRSHQPGGWTLHRLVDFLCSMCDALRYAHARGVLHRDLKPHNVMVGAFGEVLVLDWGLAKVLSAPADPALESQDAEPTVASSRSGDLAAETRAGRILGTAAYMSPEQARGEVHQLDARSDVYAVGAILYEILTGRPPFDGPDAMAIIREVIAGPPPALYDPGDGAAGPVVRWGSLSALDGPSSPLPPELAELCDRCMARDPAQRPADLEEVARVARGWLDGVQRRERALSLVEEATGLRAKIERQIERSEELRIEAEAALSALPTWEHEASKAPGWAKQDEAAQIEQEARRLEVLSEQLLYGALAHDGGNAEAHAALATRFLGLHRAAEDQRDAKRAARMEVRLRSHAEALPPAHAVRRAAATYLEGTGALTLVTDPPGAEVGLYRFVERGRRLVEVYERSLGRTPLRETALARGSYLCLIRREGCIDVRYPIEIPRGHHWDGIPPGAGSPHPVWLPPEGALADDERYIPAGPFRAGGDPEANAALPASRPWRDGFVMHRFPVTNAEYVAFLDDLVASGRVDEALAAAPRERPGGAPGELGALIYGFDGRCFALRTDADGDSWRPQMPVIMVQWHGARAYLAWLAARTGKPWRLASELEWEKAARGVDGRVHPWGDFIDPSWARVLGSARGREHGDWGPADVDTYPIDASPYGVRGLGGNVRTWCADPFQTGRASEERSPEANERTLRVVRGGAWSSSPRNAHSAARTRNAPEVRNPDLGIRGVFSLDVPHGRRFSSDG